MKTVGRLPVEDDESNHQDDHYNTQAHQSIHMRGIALRAFGMVPSTNAEIEMDGVRS
jgi:hypothetical protein